MIDAARAARLLIDAQRGHRPIDRLPAEARPQSIDDAYLIQDQLIQSAGQIGGWKVGMSGPATPPSCAPMFACDIYSSGIKLDTTRFHQRAIEIEFAFRVTKPLPAGGSLAYADIAGAIEFVPLIELLDSRFTDPAALTPEERLADRNSNGACVIGQAVPHWQSLDFSKLQVTLAVDDTLIQVARGTHPAGDPVTLVVWQAEHCRQRGLELAVGDIVTTGSLQGNSPIETGTVAVGTWEQAGQIELYL
jgi:2-keto-4-pentenoate hydratase